MGTDLNPEGVKVRLKEKEYALLFTINVIDEIQSKMNLPIFDVIEKVAYAADGDMTLENLRAFRTVLTIMLRANDPDLTEEEVGKSVTVKNYSAIALSILNAFGISVPDSDEEEEDDDDENEEEGKDPLEAGQ